jgi:hypothetical protein
VGAGKELGLDRAMDVIAGRIEAVCHILQSNAS